MRELRLPSLGAEMEEGTILEWFVKPGDRVEYGDLVALLDTEKAEIEMESFETGIIDSLLFETGKTVAAGTTIALLRESESEPGRVRAERQRLDRLTRIQQALGERGAKVRFDRGVLFRPTLP